MSEHAVLAPSAAGRWVKCAGSVKLCQQFPEPEDSESSREGTAAHWGASEVLHGRTVDIGLIAPNGVMLNEEMLEAIDVYTDDVIAVRERTGAYLAIEQRVDISCINEQNWGTPDAWLYDQEKKVIYVWDFKYGHRYVDVFENWQMLDYLAGMVDLLDINGIEDQNTWVNMAVVQPRNYSSEGPVRRWVIRLSDLRGYFNALRMAAEKALKPDALCSPNPHCIFCSARHACQALQKEALSAVEMSTSSAPVVLTPAALGLELSLVNRALEYLKARQTGLEEQALSTLKSGKLVPRFVAKPTEGRLVWSKPLKEVAMLGEMMNIELKKEATITPRQAIKKGLPEALVDAYASRESGAIKLEADDGIRAAKTFGKLIQEK